MPTFWKKNRLAHLNNLNMYSIVVSFSVPDLVKRLVPWSHSCAISNKSVSAPVQGTRTWTPESNTTNRVPSQDWFEPLNIWPKTKHRRKNKASKNVQVSSSFLQWMDAPMVCIQVKSTLRPWYWSVAKLCWGINLLGTQHGKSETSFTCLFLTVANCFTVLDDDDRGCHLHCCVVSYFRFRVLQFWRDLGGNCVDLRRLCKVQSLMWNDLPQLEQKCW